MDKSMKPAGLILSAGFSSRMKDFKPLMKIGKLTPLEILINSMKIAGIEDIFVITGFRSEDVKTFLDGRYTADNGIKCIYNPDFENGMFSSIQVGVREASQNGNTCFLMTPVDVPLIPPYIFKAVLARAKKNPDCFICPRFDGKKGHPLCIPGSMSEEVLTSKGEQGMKSVTSAHNDKMILFETHCESIIYDMDTQEAYANIVRYYNEKRYPDEKQCRKMYDRFGTPAHIIRHCEAVTNTAVCMAEELNKKGYDLNTKLLYSAGMLHDVLRLKKDHPGEGAKLAIDYGYPEIAELIKVHMSYVTPVPVKNITETDLLCLADKLRQEDKLVSLDDRLKPVKERWADNPEVLKIIEGKISAADSLLKEIERITQKDIYEVLREYDKKFLTEHEGLGPKRRLILIRHGETQRHEEKIFMGQCDIPLSDEGREQCMIVGLELQHFDINVKNLYTSDLKRARESSEIISQRLECKPHIIELPEFREMALGAWDGRYMREIKEEFPEEYEARGKDLVNYKIDENAENFHDLRDRVLKKFKELLENEKGDLLIVAHAGVNKIIVCELLGKDIEDVLKVNFGRGTYQIFEIPTGA